MSERWRRFWTPRKAISERIDKRIDKALARYAVQAAAHANEQQLKMSHRIEARAQLATVESVSMAERSAAYRIEVHAQLILAQLREQIAYVTEARSQIASIEAKAYADSGLHAISMAIAAGNRAVVGHIKRFSAFEHANAGILQKLEALDGTILGVIEQQGGLVTGTDLTSARLNSAIEDYNAQLRNAEKRIEFIRSETMFELQASLIKASIRKPVSDRHEPVSAKILNAEKLARCREAVLRLNIGCGHIQPEGYLNVDVREVPGIDIVAEATNIPLMAGEVTEIFSSHLVEHFPENILDRVLLPHWYELLENGGRLTTVAPDGAAMLGALTKGEVSFEDFREVLFGAQDYDGDFHYNLITPENFSNSLEQAGFVEIESEYIGKRNGKCFEFKISARKLHAVS